MPRKAMSLCAKAVLSQRRRVAELDRLKDEFDDLFRRYSSVRGAGLTAQQREAEATALIVELFGRVEESDFVLAKFARQALGPRPPEGTAEAADYDEFRAIALEIARLNSRLPFDRRPS